MFLKMFFIRKLSLHETYEYGKDDSKTNKKQYLKVGFTYDKTDKITF